MKKILVLANDIFGATAAIEIRKKLSKECDITIVSQSKRFLYAPSLALMPFALSKVKDNPQEIAFYAQDKKIHFIEEQVKRIFPQENKIEIQTGRIISYDFLIIAQGSFSEKHCKIEEKYGLIKCLPNSDISFVKFVILILAYRKNLNSFSNSGKFQAVNIDALGLTDNYREKKDLRQISYN